MLVLFRAISSSPFLRRIECAGEAMIVDLFLGCLFYSCEVSCKCVVPDYHITWKESHCALFTFRPFCIKTPSSCFPPEMHISHQPCSSPKTLKCLLNIFAYTENYCKTVLLQHLLCKNDRVFHRPEYLREKEISYLKGRQCRKMLYELTELTQHTIMV